jgi:hypothetical protein
LEALTVEYEIFSPRNKKIIIISSAVISILVGLFPEPATSRPGVQEREEGGCGCGSIVFALGCGGRLCKGVSSQL